jgi:hypothetical protein
MCHRASESTAGQCACGYEFGQDIDTVQRLLRQQLRSSAAATAALSVLDVTMVALIVVGQSILPALALAAFARMTLKNARKIVISRESLRQLAPRQLPTAKLLT